MLKLFQKTKEDFVCEHCQSQVSGGGYTNHCPDCLWSKHVDIHPGDRGATCSGLMEPIAVEVKGAEHTLVHQCTVCGFERKNKVTEGDSFNALLAIAEKQADKASGK